MGAKLRALYQRIGLTTASLVLAISTLTAAVPFILSQNVGAASPTTVCETGGCTYTSLQDAIDAVSDGTSISIQSDLHTSSEVRITKPVTIRGHGFTIFPLFSFVSNSGSNSVIEVLGASASNVVINNLTIEGVGGTNIHGINLYEAPRVEVTNVTIRNNDKSGLVVNRSVAIVENITTSGNGWNGINVDSTDGITNSKLRIKNVSSHSETAPIYIDDTTRPVEVIDVHNQYNYAHINHEGSHPYDRVYALKIAGPTLNTPATDSVFKTSDLPKTQSWTAVAGATQYRYESYTEDPTVNPSATPFYGENRTGTSRTIGNTAPEGKYWWRVKATVGPFESEWSAVRTFSVDNTAPVVSIAQPTGSLYSSNTEVRGTVTDENLRHYWVQVKRNGLVVYSNTVLSTGISNELLYTANLDGDYEVTLAARDTAGGGSGTGNRSVDAVKTFTVDKTAPAVPTDLAWTNADGSIVNGGVTNLYSGTASWGASDSDTVRYIYRYWNTISSSPYGASSPWENPSLTGLSAAGVFNQGEGTHFFSVAAVDHAGNVSEFSAPFEITYDATNPTVLVSATSPAGGPTGTSTISATIDDAVSYELFVDGVSVATGDATFSDFVLDTTTYTSGSYVVKVVAVDAAGNVGEGETTIVIDNDAPAALITTTGTQATATPVIEGTVDTDATELEFYINGVLQTTGLTWTTGDSTWSFTGVTFTDGDYELSIVARDTYGNEGGQLADMTVSIPVIEDDPETEEDESAPATTTTPGEVLGDQDTNPDLTPEDDEQAVEGDSTEQAAQATDADSDNDSSLLGLAWYWWVLIGAAVLGAGWWIVGAIRRRGADA